MNKFESVLLWFLIPLGVLMGGVANHVNEASIARKHAADPQSMIVFTECGRLIGIVVVDKAGRMQPVRQGANLDDLASLAERLPRQNKVTASAPCVKGENT